MVNVWGVFSAYTYKGKRNWLTQLFSPGGAKKCGNLETEGHLRQGPGAGIFPCLNPRSEELLISSHFTETQEGMCAGSWESCSLLTGWEERRKGQEQSVFTKAMCSFLAVRCR